MLATATTHEGDDERSAHLQPTRTTRTAAGGIMHCDVYTTGRRKKKIREQQIDAQIK